MLSRMKQEVLYSHGPKNKSVDYNGHPLPLMESHICRQSLGLWDSTATHTDASVLLPTRLAVWLSLFKNWEATTTNKQAQDHSVVWEHM